MAKHSMFIVPKLLWGRNLGVAYPGPLRQGLSRLQPRCWLGPGLIRRVLFPVPSVVFGRIQAPGDAGGRAFPGVLPGHLHPVGLLGRRKHLSGSLLTRPHRPDLSHLGSPT